MLKEKGIVVKIVGERVRVVVPRSGACQGCSEKASGCGCGLLGNDPEAVVTALNEAGAKPGDLVEISLPEKVLLWAAAAVYLLPMVFLVAGSIAGHLLSDRLLVSADAAAVVGAAAGLFLGVAATWTISRYAARSHGISPRITGILNSTSTFYGGSFSGKDDDDGDHGGKIKNNSTGAH